MTRVIYLSLSVLAASALLVLAQEGTEQQQQKPSTSRLGFKLPDIFSFAKFKQIHHRQYNSLAEESQRNKLFLPRAFDAFLSFSKYTLGLVTRYSGINHFSDMTPKERESLFLQPEISKELAGGNEAGPAQANSNRAEPEEIQVASLEDIERQLAEWELHKEDNPEYAHIVAELKQAAAVANRRKKRETDGGQLALDQLMPDPSQIEEPKSPKLRESVPSNNPDYQQPQLSEEQKRANLEDGSTSIPEDEAMKIDHLGRTSFLGKMARFMKRPFRSNRRPYLPTGDDQVTYDLRASGCIAEVKNQGRCASCYIFSILSVFEYLHCLQKGTLVAFSEQYVLDCGKQTNLELKGCGQSAPESTWNFVHRYGLELANNYPYSARVHKCPYSDRTNDLQMGHTRVANLTHLDLAEKNRNKENIGKRLREFGPLVIGIKVDHHFLSYGGGVDKPKNEWFAPSHAMTIVGEGIEAGQEYWLIRNSMGKDWGLKGYYKLSKDVDPGVIIKISGIGASFEKNDKHSDQVLEVGLADQ